MSARRLVGWALLTIGLAVGPGVAAHARTLDEYLQSGADARFSGSQAVSCATPDGEREVIVDLVQSDGVFQTVASPGEAGRVTVAAGTLAVVRPDGSRSSTAVAASAAPVAGDYSIAAQDDVDLLGRPATVVGVRDSDGIDRAELAFDEATGALLSSRVFNADGSVYCETTMVHFDEQATGAGSLPEPGAPLEPVPSHRRLPLDVAGFRLLDAYRWEDGGVVGFYSDGLFTFSLLATPGPVELAADDVSEVSSERGTYARWFGPAQVVMAWDAEEGGLAVSGDLPLDLLDEVTAELPPPRPANLLTRVWRNLFG